MITLATAAPAVGAAFLASLVEVVEAFTIVLAAGTLRGWRPAISGTAAGLAVLAAIVIVLGPLLGQVPVHALELVIGVLLLLFGSSWLRKAVLRAAGIIPLRDENTKFAAETARLNDTEAPRRGRFDWLGATMAFKAVLLEGIEVAFIVIAVGAGRGLVLPASSGRWRHSSSCSASAWRCAVRSRAFPRTRSSSRWASCSARSACSGPVRASASYGLVRTS
jgi:uncharacterized membrane protein